MGDWVEIAVTHAPEETKALAVALARVLQSGAVLALDGDLGAGKTHFTQGLAAGLGIAQVVTSPTFNLMAVYEGGRLPLYHFDLYRLEDPEQLEDIGFYEFIEGDGVSCVEWASKFADELPDDRLEIYLGRGAAETERVVKARARGASPRASLEAWRSSLAGF